MSKRLSQKQTIYTSPSPYRSDCDEILATEDHLMVDQIEGILYRAFPEFIRGETYTKGERLFWILKALHVDGKSQREVSEEGVPSPLAGKPNIDLSISRSMVSKLASEAIAKIREKLGLIEQEDGRWIEKELL